MFPQWRTEALNHRLADFSPDTYPVQRSAALYAASITLADSEGQRSCLLRLGQLHVPRDQLYEVVLQSYLFLGFPRMLKAAEVFHRIMDKGVPARKLDELQVEDMYDWLHRGDLLCRSIYAEKFDPLKRKVSQMAPEVFQWMILEGYGKVLARPMLDIVSREMAILSCLMIEQHVPQLRAHVNGALNVGAPVDLIETVIDDLADIAGEGAGYAREAVRSAIEQS